MFPGNLIRKQEYNGTLGTTTDYIDGFVYLAQGTGAAALSYFPMPEGRVLNNAGTLKQEFIITDQQGNARLAFQDSGNGTPVVTQENSYYAFGLIMPNSPVATPGNANKQLYNGGSEWQNDYSNLPDYYQTFNRNYDAALGRFIGVDPKAESAESMSTYQYSGNNPVMYNDPMGDKAKLPIPPTNNSSGGDPYLTEDSDGNTIVQANSNNFSGGGDSGYQLGFGGIPIFNQNYMGIPGATSTTIYNTGSDGSPAVGSLQDLANVLRNYAGNTNTGISYYFSGNGAYEGALWNGGASNNYNKQKSDYANGVITVTYPQISETEGLALLDAAGIQDSQDGDQCQTCLIPESLGHNLVGVYGGPFNPMSYNHTENYSTQPVNYTDVNTMNHDLYYDHHQGVGAGSVFFSANVLPGDYDLIRNSFEVTVSDRANLTDKVESLGVGIFFIYATAPKSAVYWTGIVIKNIFK